MKTRVLSEAQEQAANHFEGPALVLAGPGSGKTTVLIERTIRLACRTGKPQNILCVTFTNAAAEEMQQRYIKAQREEFDEIPVFKTVHSFCNSIIGEYENITQRRYTRIDASDGLKVEILRRIYKEINGVEADNYTARRIGENVFAGGKDPEIKNIKRIRKAYAEYKHENKLIDFDDMICIAADILNSDDIIKRRVREHTQEFYKYVQIDEAQDLTKDQFDVLKTVGISQNIFVVADDDQSIYGFRGAAPECLMSFYKGYSNCKLYHLSRNYRSTQSIVSISSRFIRANSDRFDKDLFSKGEEGCKLKIKSFKNSILQAEFIKDELKQIRKIENKAAVGILYRNHISGILPQAVLLKNNIEFYFNEDAACRINQHFTELVLSEIRRRQRGSFIVPSPSKVLRILLEDGLENKIDAYCRHTRQHLNFKDNMLPFIIYLCRTFNTADEITKLLDGFDNRKESGSNDSNKKENSVFFSTVHSAKGLEYDSVFIIDAVMGEFPGTTASSGKLLEEERRLFYVALTRAKRSVYITYPLTRGNLYEKRPAEKESIFVSELRKLG